jgi:hypothetical protein
MENQNQFVKLVFSDRSSYDISPTLFQKLENFKERVNDGIIYIERNPEYFRKYILPYIQGYSDIEITDHIDFSTFINEISFYGVKVDIQHLINIQPKIANFKENIDIVRSYFRRIIDRKSGHFRGFQRMKKWR